MKLDRKLPAAELIEAGLRSYRDGEATVGSLLVAVGLPRLRSLGLTLPTQPTLSAKPELELYRLLAARHGRGAHSQYNALIRRLVSFERALARSRAT